MCNQTNRQTCAKLFEGYEASFIGNPQRSISGVAYQSNNVQPGNAFCCIVGLKSDGHAFVQDAYNHGARVFVVQHEIELNLASENAYGETGQSENAQAETTQDENIQTETAQDGVTFVVVSDTRKAMAHLAAQFYKQPSKRFSLVGITGTNGKTTTAFLVNHIAHSVGKTTGLIGTVEISIAGKKQPSTHTTPESCDLQKLFSEMRSANCSVVTMEVSSHALDLDRTWESNFEVTAFTNLTQDHLDYHKTFESYFAAKEKLFSNNYPAKRVINIDTPWGKRLLADAQALNNAVLTTGFSAEANIHPVSVSYGTDKTQVTLYVQDTELEIEYPLVGRFNVENVMSAFAICLQLGFSAQDIAAALVNVPPVPGRIERVSVPKEQVSEKAAGISVYVDYAHTPDAIEKAVASVQQLTNGKTFVVFGCGGDRDATKRPLMGKAALAADYVVVTSDNPRTEKPSAIIEDILQGMRGQESRFCVEPDRRLAIRKAFELANIGDAVLIAGKGHEDYQIIGTLKHSFDDRSVAREELLLIG